MCEMIIMVMTFDIKTHFDDFLVSAHLVRFLFSYLLAYLLLTLWPVRYTKTNPFISKRVKIPPPGEDLKKPQQVKTGTFA